MCIRDRYFPALLPEISEEDPQAVLDAGGVPSLAEMRLHNLSLIHISEPTRPY